MEVEGFKKTYNNLGIAAGTPEYERCLLKQQAISENASQHSMDRIEMEERARKKTSQNPPNIVIAERR
ncbi:MAG TPA: hypothetical protein DD666_16000 [Advenella kashmirensis]|uniref:Uncharacterized protein n=1 Tax=Advenella kashmirensis TaxID=310575 RepID=A0A356LIU0_9BURK|nr:hypothetical protein [Advenella kashmirensis]